VGLRAGLVDRLPVARAVPHLRDRPPHQAGLGGVRGLPGRDRGDLPREYDDGGLVDVNHVPVGVFSSALGLTAIEARDVLAARDKLGRFVSAEELCEYTQLSPDRVDELRDLMIFT
jgi:hypothetical protein